MSEHKYAQLADRLRTEIQNGVYTGGQRLPSENELASATGYSRQTVRQAMALAGFVAVEGACGRWGGHGALRAGADSQHLSGRRSTLRSRGCRNAHFLIAVQAYWMRGEGLLEC